MNLVFPLTFLAFISSRPVGTMSHFTDSAWIQYSLRGPVFWASRVVGDPVVSVGAPLRRLDLRRHLEPPARVSTSAFRLLRISCPARVQSRTPPASAKNSRRPRGRGLIS